MTEELELAVCYRERAEELRASADSKDAKENREALLGVAASYERMAASMEAIDKTNKSLAQRPNSK